MAYFVGFSLSLPSPVKFYSTGELWRVIIVPSWYNIAWGLIYHQGWVCKSVVFWFTNTLYRTELLKSSWKDYPHYIFARFRLTSEYVVRMIRWSGTILFRASCCCSFASCFCLIAPIRKLAQKQYVFRSDSILSIIVLRVCCTHRIINQISRNLQTSQHPTTLTSFSNQRAPFETWNTTMVEVDAWEGRIRVWCDRS